jgi:hypothetical protein
VATCRSRNHSCPSTLPFRTCRCGRAGDAPESAQWCLTRPGAVEWFDEPYKVFAEFHGRTPSVPGRTPLHFVCSPGEAFSTRNHPGCVISASDGSAASMGMGRARCTLPGGCKADAVGSGPEKCGSAAKLRTKATFFCAITAAASL